MKRRRFIGILIGFTIGSIVALFVLRSKFSMIKKLAVGFIKPQLDLSAPTGSLSEDEMKTIIALGAVLLPAGETSIAQYRDGFIRDYVNQRTEGTKGYLKEYKEGIKILEEATKKVNKNKRFFELSPLERDKVLASILWRYSGDETKKRNFEYVFLSKRKIAFRQFIVGDIIKAFFRSPIGRAFAWATVGYSHYPGLPAADPRDYTKPIEISWGEVHL